jgi:hypothetical protein
MNNLVKQYYRKEDDPNTLLQEDTDGEAVEE